MNENDEVLFKGDYISVIKSGNGYERAHDRTGEVIAILPFVVGQDGEVLFLTRWEPRSAWGDNPQEEFMSSITGGVEEGETALGAAVREIHEEAGIECEASDFLSLGEIFGAKCLDTHYFLFAIDITECGFLENGITDGSTGEALAHNELADYETLIDDAADTLLLTMVLKFKLECERRELLSDGTDADL